MVITTAQLHLAKSGQVLGRFKSCSRRIRDSRWWGSLTVVLAGNKTKRLSSVSHTTKAIHYQFIITLREKCPNTEFFWSVFSRIWNEYGEILRDTQSECGKIRTRKNYIFGHFSRSVIFYQLNKSHCLIAFTCWVLGLWLYIVIVC